MTLQKPDAPALARHRTDVVSLIFGLLFLAVAGWWAAAHYLDWVIPWDIFDVGWIFAGALVLLGLIGIAASLCRDRRETTLATPDATDQGQAAALPDDVPTPADPPYVRPEEPTTNLDRSAAAEPPADVRPHDPIMDLDPPAAGDPGGHRPA